MTTRRMMDRLELLHWKLEALKCKNTPFQEDKLNLDCFLYDVDMWLLKTSEGAI